MQRARRMVFSGLLGLVVFGTQSLFGCVTNVIPFGVTTNVFAGTTLGGAFSVNNDSIGSGRGGKINLNGYMNVAAWSADMVGLGCGCQVCDGVYPIITGNAGVSAAFISMGVSAVFIMPLVDFFDTAGSKPANIIGFVLVKILSIVGNGSNWTVTLQLLTAPLPPNDLTSDSDGDGSSDFAEFYAGTDPTNSASFFRITSIVRETDDFRIAWMTASGKTNALERSDNVSSGFTAILTVTNTSGATTNYLDLGAVTNIPPQFYRVRLVP
jgi:hypothetical protein